MPEPQKWPALDRALAEWAKRNLLSPEEFDLLRMQFTSRAGLLAGVWDQRFTAALYQSILSSLEKGETFADWYPRANEIMKGFGATVYGMAGEDMAPWYAELVFRNATNAALNGGKYASMFSPQRTRIAPYVMYFAIEDDRICDYCEPLDGQVFRKDDAVARHLFPPNHHNCRCTLVEMDLTDVEEGKYPIRHGAEFPMPPGDWDTDRVLELVPGALWRVAA